MARIIKLMTPAMLVVAVVACTCVPTLFAPGLSSGVSSVDPCRGVDAADIGEILDRRVIEDSMGGMCSYTATGQPTIYISVIIQDYPSEESAAQNIENQAAHPDVSFIDDIADGAAGSNDYSYLYLREGVTNYLVTVNSDNGPPGDFSIHRQIADLFLAQE